MPTEEVPAPTREIPYVGPTPFQREDQALFFGRRHEANELLSLVTAHPAVLLYSQSGAGKTSLLNASLVPMLEADGFDVAGPARVRPKVPEDFDYGEANPYVFNALTWLAGDAVVPPPTARVTLADYLKKRFPTDNAGRLVRPCVLIFDQFEELFTLSPEFWGHRKDFFEQVARALADPLLRVLFAMREDFIAELDPYESLVPEKLRTRFRLERLREHAAQAAITGPLGVEPWKKAGRTFARGVAEKLVTNLREIPSKTDAQGRPVLGEFVEPVQLQIVCEAIWRGLGEDDKQITVRHLEEFGNINEALTTFYERCIKEAVRAANEAAEKRSKPELREGTLRAWFDGVLITETGKRGIVLRTRHTTGGIPNAAVDALEARFLVRAEVRGGERWYELSHDRFIQPIKESYKRWLLDQPGAERTRLRLEEKAAAWFAKRDPAFLLDAGEVLEARRHESSGVSYSPALQALISASETAIQQRRADEKARNTRRLSWALGAAVVLLVTAGALGVSAYNNAEAATQSAAAANREKERANLNAKEAQEQRDLAISEKGRANQAASQAQEQRERADKQREIAEEKTKEAERARKAAEESKAEAERQRGIAIAKAAEAEKQKNAALEAREREAEARAEAEKQRLDAVRQTEIAIDEKKKADEAREQEALARKTADEARKTAEQKEEIAKQETARAETSKKESETKLATCNSGKLSAEEQAQSLQAALDSSQVEVQRLRAKYEPASNTPKTAAAFLAQGLQREAAEDFEGAAASYTEALNRYQGEKNYQGQAEAGEHLAELRLRQKQYEPALKAYQAAFSAYKDDRDVEGQFDVYDKMRAAVLTRVNELGARADAATTAAALDVLDDKILDFYDEFKTEQGRDAQAATLDAIGDVKLVAAGNSEQYVPKLYEDAVESYTAAKVIYVELAAAKSEEQERYEKGEAQMLFNIGHAFHARAEKVRAKEGLGFEAAKPFYLQAVNHYEASRKAREKLEDLAGQIASCTNLGEVYRSLGDTKESLRYFGLVQELQEKQKQQPPPPPPQPTPRRRGKGGSRPQ
jgi:tetratricopeptide (TPR) repeat protein